MHRISTKARFIIPAPKCSMKLLSKAVTGALKLIYKQIENYNFKIQYYSNVTTLWPVESNQSAIEAIIKLNSRN